MVRAMNLNYFDPTRIYKQFTKFKKIFKKKQIYYFYHISVGCCCRDCSLCDSFLGWRVGEVNQFEQLLVVEHLVMWDEGKLWSSWVKEMSFDWLMNHWTSFSYRYSTCERYASSQHLESIVRLALRDHQSVSYKKKRKRNKIEYFCICQKHQHNIYCYTQLSVNSLYFNIEIQFMCARVKNQCYRL